MITAMLFVGLVVCALMFIGATVVVVATGSAMNGFAPSLMGGISQQPHQGFDDHHVIPFAPRLSGAGSRIRQDGEGSAKVRYLRR